MIKKSLGILLALFVILAAAPAASAVTPTLSISGPTTVRAGNTITLSVYLNGTGIKGTQGSFTYDSSKLTYKSCGGTLSGWSFDIDGSAAGRVTFLGIDDSSTDKNINSKTKIFTLTFAVKSGLAAGTNIKVSSQGVNVSDGNKDISVAAASYSVNLAAPLSSNANLKSLSVSNAEISPVFSASTTSYTAAVPFDVSSLNVTAAAQDTGAAVNVSGTALAVGANTVTVTVTAPSGATKVYTISVTRAQDPNYVPGSNAKLKSLTPDAGILSPLFDPEVTEYAVYLPYENESVSISGEAQDDKAAGVAGAQATLELGGNRLKITVTAEDGTTMDYFVTVFRMERYEATSGTETTPEETTDTTEPTETAPAETTASGTTAGPTGDFIGNFKDIPFWIVVTVCVVCAMIGFGACFFIMRGKRE